MEKIRLGSARRGRLVPRQSGTSTTKVWSVMSLLAIIAEY